MRDIPGLPVIREAADFENFVSEKRQETAWQEAACALIEVYSFTAWGRIAKHEFACRQRKTCHCHCQSTERSSMSIRITIRDFTGASFPLDVELTDTVLELKQLIVAAGKGKSVRAPAISFKEHELRDGKQLVYYDINARDTIHICETSCFR